MENMTKSKIIKALKKKVPGHKPNNETLAALFDRPMTWKEILLRNDGPWATISSADRRALFMCSAPKNVMECWFGWIATTFIKMVRDFPWGCCGGADTFILYGRVSEEVLRRAQHDADEYLRNRRQREEADQYAWVPLWASAKSIGDNSYDYLEPRWTDWDIELQLARAKNLAGKSALKFTNHFPDDIW